MPTTTGKKIAIVTGSALGLGYELASQLIANGWLVAGVDFNAERQAELTAQWPDDSYRAFVGDITDEGVRERIRGGYRHARPHRFAHQQRRPAFVQGAHCLRGRRRRQMSQGTQRHDSVDGGNPQGLRRTECENRSDYEYGRHARQRERKRVLRHQVGREGLYQESAGRHTRAPVSRWSPVYPGGIDTAFYRDSRDYVSEAKQHTFMQPGPLAEVILFNLINEANLTVTDIEINRNS